MKRAQAEKMRIDIARMLNEAEVFIRAREYPNALDKADEILVFDPRNEAAKKIRTSILQLMKNY